MARFFFFGGGSIKPPSLILQEHEVERLELVREELKKATEVLGEELRRES